MTASEAPPRVRPLPVSTRVRRVERLAPELVRVVLGTDDWSRFGDPTYADAYVKLVFLTPGVDYPRPIDPARIRAEMPAHQWARTRTYTVREFDRDAGSMTIDIVTHGTEGLAGAWALTAQPGDEVLIQGPGGGYSPDPDADWHLLAGDESALPAIAAALERVPAGTPATAFVEISGPDAEIALPNAPGLEVHWLHRENSPVGSRLTEAVRSWPLPAGTGQFFVHGEAGFVRDLRRYLRVERGLPMAQLSISGYWRLGADDEGWREVKRAWNKAIDESEADAGRP